MNTCKSCRHWLPGGSFHYDISLFPFGDQDELAGNMLLDYDQNRDEPYPFTKHKEWLEAFRQEPRIGECSLMAYGGRGRERDDRAAVSFDHEGYQAGVLTRDTFGCTEWTAKD